MCSGTHLIFDSALVSLRRKIKKRIRGTKTFISIFRFVFEFLFFRLPFIYSAVQFFVFTYIQLGSDVKVYFCFLNKKPITFTYNFTNSLVCYEVAGRKLTETTFGVRCLIPEYLTVFLVVVHSLAQGSFVYMPSQWETTLHCNIICYWLGAYKIDSLLSNLKTISNPIDQTISHDDVLP